jgi:hypothetical protein
MIFIQVHASQRIIALHPMFIYCSSQLLLLCLFSFGGGGCRYPSFPIQRGRGYKESNRVGYNVIPIRTLSLLSYFTDIASMPWGHAMVLYIML